MRIEWSADAVSDLTAISSYLEEDRNLETPNRVARAIYDVVQSLQTMPYRGRYGRLENTRELMVPRLPYGSNRFLTVAAPSATESAGRNHYNRISGGRLPLLSLLRAEVHLL